MRPGVKGTLTSTPPSFAAFSTPAQPPRTIKSAIETFLPNSFWIVSSFASTVLSWVGWLTSQSFCGLRRMRAPLAPPRLSEPLRHCQPGGEDLGLQCGNVLVIDQRVIDRRDRVLPNQGLLRDQRA